MKKTGLFLCMLVAVTTLSAQKKVTLGYDLRKGETYYQTTYNDMVMNHKIKGLGFSITDKIEKTLSYEVLEKRNDCYRIAVRYESLKKSTTAPNGKNTVMSMDDTFGDLRGVVFNITMERSGKVREVAGLDSLPSSLRNIGLVKVEDLRSSLDMEIYPQAPVAVGEKWIVSQNMDLGGLATINNAEYEYLRDDGKDRILRSYSEIVPDGSAANATVPATLKSKSGGEYVVCGKTGWVKSFSGTMEMEGGRVMETPKGKVNVVMEVTAVITQKGTR